MDDVPPSTTNPGSGATRARFGQADLPGEPAQDKLPRAGSVLGIDVGYCTKSMPIKTAREGTPGRLPFGLAAQVATTA
jgi:hypothetical protein